MRFKYDTYSCMRDHNIAGAVVAFLPNFVQPIFWLWIVCECFNHVGRMVTNGICAALHSVRIVVFASSFFLFLFVVEANRFAVCNKCHKNYNFYDGLSQLLDNAYQGMLLVNAIAVSFQIFAFGCWTFHFRVSIILVCWQIKLLDFNGYTLSCFFSYVIWAIIFFSLYFWYIALTSFALLSLEREW